MASNISFKHEDAYKLLLRFRYLPTAIEGFIMLSTSMVTITDIGYSQVLLGKLEGDTLVSTVYSFDYGKPYNELFNSLCALCSSETPMIIRHTITSNDDRIITGFGESRLGSYTVNQRVSHGPTNLTLTANIRYPQA